MATVICVTNQKGGIGKTTTATTIASILQERGNKVLLIDTDVQCNSTDTYQAVFEGVPTLYDVILEEEKSNIMEAIQHTPMGDIVAADPLLREGDSKLSTQGIKGYKVLKEALKELEGYDYVIFDTAPAISMILRAALVAADYLVIPITADRYGIQGLYELNVSINDAKELNPNLKIGGILLVRYNERTILARDVRGALETVAEEMGTKIYKNTIRECNKVKEAQTVRSTLIKYDKHCTAARDYDYFVDEMLEEVENG